MTETPPKQGGASLDAGNEVSGPVQEFFCQPCCHGDKRSEVFGFCRDCSEYLCEECYMYHTRLSICRNHNLLDKESMPRDQPCNVTSDRCILKCNVHDTEMVKYFCGTDGQLGCGVCMILNHRQCEGVEYIPAVSNDYIRSKDYKQFTYKIETMIKLSKHIIEATKENVARSAQYYSQAVHNVQRLREEINRAIDQLEKDVKSQTEALSKEDNKRLTAISDKCENVLQELCSLSAKFKILQETQQYSRLFIDSKQSLPKISDLEAVLKLIENKTVVKYNFMPSKEVQTILKTPDKFGKLFKWDLKEVGANHVGDINVKTSTDRNTCCITGSVMVTEDKLVIADRINDKIKCVDIKLGIVVCELNLPSSPWDIAGVGEARFAVTLPTEKKVLIVLCEESTLRVDAEINLASECWGIAVTNGKLVVTHEDPGSVDILDMTGSVLKSFSTDEVGHELFKRPSYAAVTADLQSIYVADWDSNSVTCLDGQGRVQQVYKDADLEYPGKLVIDQTGVVTVCGINSSNVHLISSDCTKIQIFSNTEKLDHPRTLSYSLDNESLYVGMWENDNIRVYQLR